MKKMYKTISSLVKKSIVKEGIISRGYIMLRLYFLHTLFANLILYTLLTRHFNRVTNMKVYLLVQH